MRKLVSWNLQSLDGYFEGTKPWDLDFHETAWGEELERFSIDQLQEIGVLLFGRVTYQGMADYWSTAKGEIADLMNAVPKVVFSSTLDAASWTNSRLVQGDAGDAVAELKRAPGKDLFVFGSARLSASLMERGLFDEYRICVAPIVLGKGEPLFKAGIASRRLRLLDSRPLKTGAMVLRYAPSERAT
jgi:dihydrofolate reductase